MIKESLYNNKIFRVNFDESTKNFDKNDGILAIFYFLYIMVILYLFGLLMFRTNVPFKFAFYFPLAIIELLPAFVIVKVKKQSLNSIGIRSDKIIKSILLGIIFSLPFIVPNIIYGIKNRLNLISAINIVWLSLYYLLAIAFVEEVCFRGFIQTRIFDLIKSKWLGIITAGIMFGLSHIPFQMLNANKSLIAFVTGDYMHLIITILLHIYFVYIFTRDNNIVSTTVTHALIDLIPSIFVS